MKKLALLLTIFILNSIFLFFSFIHFLFNDTYDLIIARSIPRYENATVWEPKGISSPDVGPFGEITLHTSDSIDKIGSYYANVLPTQGWKNEGWKTQEHIEGKSIHFTKIIQGKPYDLSIQDGFSDNTFKMINISRQL